jgi:phosphodiesterase/alkaline phosphatase D-like protein
VLPSQAGFNTIGGGVFWPLSTDPNFPLVGVFDPTLPGGFPSSDHKLVFKDIEITDDSLSENGVASGDVTHDSAVLWARSLAAGQVTFEVATDAAFTDVVATASANSLGNVPVKVTIDGLEDGTHYHYRAISPTGDSQTGEFSTAHESGHQGLSFGVSGDWRGGLTPLAALSNADDAGLDFFVELGDTIYADIPSPRFPGPQAETVADFHTKYAETLSERGGENFLADLRASTAVFATIDDHEVTNDFAGGAPPTSDSRFNPTGADFINETGLYANGLEAFHDYHSIAERVWSGTGEDRVDGAPDLYRTQAYGDDAAVFMLDARSFRDEELENADPGNPDDVGRFLAESFDPGRTMLGNPQLERLEADLLAAQDDGIVWKFVMVPEPIQNLGPVGAADRFEGYAAERTELLRFIDDNDIDNVVFVTADIHGTLVNNLTYQTTLGGPQIALDAFEISTGAVAFSPELGPTVVALGVAAGLITPAQAAFYASLPVANDGDSAVNDKDDFVKSIINNGLDQFGYDRLGLNNNLAAADGLVDATLLQGDYVATHSFSWTAFDIDPHTQVLTVTTYGIPSYTEAEALADPAGIAARMPIIVSQFEVHPDLTKVGGAGNDVINGGKGDDDLDGRGGNDRIDGREGDDHIRGGSGDDTIAGGAGDDLIDGGAGKDEMEGGAGSDMFIGALPHDRERHDFFDWGRRLEDDDDDWGHHHGGDSYDGGAGIDTLAFSGAGRAVELDLADGVTRFGSATIVDIENLTGGQKGDRLAGNAKANDLRGNGGDDELEGEKGDDLLFGGDGRDELDGGHGHDVLFGGKDRDTLTGGKGVDWFVFNNVEDGKDVIRDFTTRGPDRDVIVLANTMFSNFTGDDGADLVAGGFLRANISHGMTEVQVDIDGGGNSWQTIAELSQRLSSAGVAGQVIVHPDWVI